jgi:hypothetical protein
MDQLEAAVLSGQSMEASRGRLLSGPVQLREVS